MRPYPATADRRDQFILDHRPGRAAHDPWRSHGTLIEQERTARGAEGTSVTIFITGRECPWRCVMCDLWLHTLETDTPVDAVPVQISDALRTMGRAPAEIDVLKLYNAGSFFDTRAVPPADYPAIARSVAEMRQVVVESHPALVGPRTLEWRQTLDSPTGLEVAMGLETVHPEALARLNKRMTSDDFARAADRLAALDIALRAFVLVSPPFIAAADQEAWLVRSVDFAFACGATVVSLIPTRPGNGATDALAQSGEFVVPGIGHLEHALTLGLARARPEGARVFADVWDLRRFSQCPRCFEPRRDRLVSMNLNQRPLPPVGCQECGSA
jgi:archaeosine synthase beta-subunit